MTFSGVGVAAVEITSFVPESSTPVAIINLSPTSFTESANSGKTEELGDSNITFNIQKA